MRLMDGDTLPSNPPTPLTQAEGNDKPWTRRKSTRGYEGEYGVEFDANNTDRLQNDKDFCSKILT